MVLLMSRFNTVRIQREYVGWGRKQHSRKQQKMKGQLLVSWIRKKRFLGLAREGGHGSEQRLQGINCTTWLGARERGRRWEEEGAGACLDPAGKCASADRHVFRKVEDSLFTDHDTKQP